MIQRVAGLCYNDLRVRILQLGGASLLVPSEEAKRAEIHERGAPGLNQGVSRMILPLWVDER